MDASMMRWFLLGDLRVAEDDISPELWVELFVQALVEVRSKLKYIRYFTTIAHLLSDSPRSSINGFNRVTSMTRVTFFPGISPDTPCILLNQLKDPIRHPKGPGPLYEVDALYLTVDGSVFRFVAVYEEFLSEATEKPAFKTIRCLRGNFTLIKSDDLLGLVKSHPSLVRESANALLSAIDDSISMHRSWAENLQKVRSCIVTPYLRIDSK